MAEQCELKLRQVLKYTVRSDGGLLVSAKVGSWPTAA